MADLAARAEKDYDEIEIDLASSGGHGASAGSGYVDDTTPIGTGSGRRLLPRGERCGRCFRRRIVRYVVMAWMHHDFCAWKSPARVAFSSLFLCG